MSLLPARSSKSLLVCALDLALIVLFPVVAVLAILAMPYLLARRAYVRIDTLIDTLQNTAA
jgi:hypothetical protein